MYLKALSKCEVGKNCLPSLLISTSSKIIFNRSFNKELIKEYMNVAYQGNADIEFLEDITFEIVKCSECNLL
jgi:hypothetical protein